MNHTILNGNANGNAAFLVTKIFFRAGPVILYLYLAIVLSIILAIPRLDGGMASTTPTFFRFLPPIVINATLYCNLNEQVPKKSVFAIIQSTSFYHIKCLE